MTQTLPTANAVTTMAANPMHPHRKRRGATLRVNHTESSASKLIPFQQEIGKLRDVSRQARITHDSVVNCITTQHNIWLVLVAALVCVSGSGAVVRLFLRGRSVNGAEAIGWQFLAATAAGASIWSTHFIAIVAYHAGTSVTFDPVLTIISLLIAVTGSFCGFIFAGMVRTSWAPAVGGALIGLSIAGMH